MCVGGRRVEGRLLICVALSIDETPSYARAPSFPPLFPPKTAVIATKGRESDYESVKTDALALCAELNAKVASSVVAGR